MAQVTSDREDLSTKHDRHSSAAEVGHYCEACTIFCSFETHDSDDERVRIFNRWISNNNDQFLQYHSTKPDKEW